MLRSLEISYQMEIVPTDKQVAMSLVDAGILRVSSEEIVWGPTVGEQEVVFEGNMHHPIHQLFGIFVKGGFELNKQVRHEATGIVHTEPVAPGFPPIIPEVRMKGSPRDLIEHFEGVEELGLVDEIAQAKKILLTGCVSANSAISLARSLSERGFRGELNINDIAKEPLLIATHLYKQFGLEEELGVSLVARQVDLRKIVLGNHDDSPWRSDYDIVITDVLGHYFGDDDFEMSLSTILSSTLKSGGLLLARDMGEHIIVESAKRDVSVVPKLDQTRIDYSVWLTAQFGVDISIETLNDVLDNIWPETNHKPRGLYLEDYWNYLLSGHGLENIYTDYVVPEGVDPKDRYFCNMVYRRPEQITELEKGRVMTSYELDENFQVVC